jgi:hypothetical protein
MAVDATIALTSLATARIHCQIPTEKTQDDSKIERLINAASQFCMTYCDRKFVSASHTEYFHGRRQNFIMPRQWPVTAVASLKVHQDRDWSASSALVPAADYVIADEGTSIYYEGYFPNGFSNVQLVYTGGYTTIPYDLEQACLQLVEWWYRHNQRQDIGRTSSSKMDESVGVLAEVPKHIIQVLEVYKRIEFPSSYSPVGNL